MTLWHHVVCSTRGFVIGSRCSLSIAFHTYSHSHTLFLRFVVHTDPVSVSSISSSLRLCIVKITACSIHINSEWPFLLIHTCSVAEYQVPHSPLSNCTIVQLRGVNIINGSQLEGKDDGDFSLLFSQAASIKSKWMVR